MLLFVDCSSCVVDVVARWLLIVVVACWLFVVCGWLLVVCLFALVCFD